jgi:hypothetical protein
LHLGSAWTVLHHNKPRTMIPKIFFILLI